MPTPIRPTDLVFHFLNVGHGDAIVVELPPDSQGRRHLGVVDCYKAAKTKAYMEHLRNARPVHGVAFVCATHPHRDHIEGIEALLTDPATRPAEFWDSGFRHNSLDYKSILETVRHQGIQMLRVSSGMEWYFGKARVTALAPSVALRNRYATYGVDMNNASVVLRFEHCRRDVVTVESLRYKGQTDPERVRRASSAVAILGGDAEFDSWAQVCEEYPHRVSSSAHKPLVHKLLNLLKCGVLKVAHHGSMHSAPLEVLEQMEPTLAVVSNEQRTSTIQTASGPFTRELFPHPTTAIALREVKATVLTTDGSFETAHGTAFAHPGTIVAVISPGRAPRFTKLNDNASTVLPPPPQV